MEELPVGSLIRDGEKLGIIKNVIKAGTWTGAPLFNWITSYEIRYLKGGICIMTHSSLVRFVEKGKIEILSK